MSKIKIPETFKLPGTEVILEAGQEIEIVEALSGEDSGMFENMVLDWTKKYDPKDLAELLVSGIMNGISESDYGSDDRFLKAFRRALKEYEV